MKKLAIFGCIAAALLSFAGCEETGTDYEGINYIYLSSEGDKIFESDQTPLTIEAMLTTTLDEDLTLTFVVKGTEGVVELQNNPVTIKAGEKTAKFEVVPLNAGKLAEAANFTVALDATAVLPSNVELKNEFAFVVNPAPITGDFTDAQIAMLTAYRTATGIDLSKYIGTVDVNTVITGLDIETGEPFEVSQSGKTVIALSDASTAEKPVLKMVSNAMGIEKHVYDIFKALTIENYYWFPDDYEPVEGEENPFAIYETLCNTISWSGTSNEIFEISLDGISFNADKTVDFVTEVYHPYVEDDLAVVPFTYSFTAYDREKAAIEAGDLEDQSYMLCTANPEYYFNWSGILEDEWEAESGIFVLPSAALTEAGLVFTFCFDFDSSYAWDYTRVVATYTPNN